mgnify:CR=1 FL=1
MFTKNPGKNVDFAPEISTVDPLPPPDNFPTFDDPAPPPQRCVPDPNLLLFIYGSGSILNSLSKTLIRKQSYRIKIDRKKKCVKLNNI